MTQERYELLGELATGGMATVYVARQRGELGFSRLVAVKSMHAHLAKDPEFRAMFLDEANLTARIRHPSVVPTLDIVTAQNKLLLVMEYVEGVPLSMLLSAMTARGKKMPPEIAVAIARDVLDGLHAAHELAGDDGKPLGVVHRDVSPQNVLVGVDGLARVVDFGVAKAHGALHTTRTGEIKGKVAYMSPEQLFGEPVDRRADVYATGIVLWEALAGVRLFDAPNDVLLIKQVTEGGREHPSKRRGEPLPIALDEAVLRALALAPTERFASAQAMAQAIAKIVPPAPRDAVAALVRDVGDEELARRASLTKRNSMPPLEDEAKTVLDVLSRAALASDASLPTVRRPRKALGWLVAAAAITLALGATAFGIRAASQRRAAAPPTASAPAPAPASAPAPAPASADASADPSASADAPRRPGAWRRRPPPAASGPKPDCALPYVVDAEGHRHYKAECLP